MLQQLAITLIALGSTFTLYNWLMVYLTWRTGRFHSCIGLVGGLPLAVGLLWFPATRLFAWVPLVLDWGTLMFLLALPQIVDELWSTSRFNLLEEYAGQRDGRKARLCLFRRGVFTMQFERPDAQCGLVEVGSIGTWQREEGRLMLIPCEDSATFWDRNRTRSGLCRLMLVLTEDSATLEPLAGRGDKAIVQTSPFRAVQSDEPSLAGMELSLKYRRRA
jgi:hypothetical protein